MEFAVNTPPKTSAVKKMLYFSNIKSELQGYANPHVFYDLKPHAIPVTMLHQFPGDSTAQ